MTRDSLREGSLGGLQIARAPLSLAEIYQRLQPVLTLADAVAKRLDTRSVIAAQKAEITQPEPGVYTFGLVLNHLFHALLRVLRIAQLFVEMAEIPQRTRERRGNLKGALISLASGGQVAALLQSSAEVGVGQIALRL